ncbi:hypothetical protein, partial [Paenibacillus contaminans]|uniref:hypothetical protein n=1 Tax=Paenibacillus contaminans TaxID=450362 RepID=UPI001EDCB727
RFVACFCWLYFAHCSVFKGQFFVAFLFHLCRFVFQRLFYLTTSSVYNARTFFKFFFLAFRCSFVTELPSEAAKSNLSQDSTLSQALFSTFFSLSNNRPRKASSNAI